MEELKEQLQKSIREVPKFDKLENHIDMTVTNEGLRIELTESAMGTFFDSGSARMSTDGGDLLKLLAAELGKLPNHLAIEGHTDSKQYPPGATYTNWELSADRANAARRLMQENGIHADQVTQVRGFADQKLRKPDSPTDPSNRRISSDRAVSREKTGGRGCCRRKRRRNQGQGRKDSWTKRKRGERNGKRHREASGGAGKEKGIVPIPFPPAHSPPANCAFESHSRR